MPSNAVGWRTTMDMNKPDPAEVQAVFGVQLGNRTLGSVAEESKILFVRSQIQIAFDNEDATGMRLVAQEALRMFGWSILRQLAHKNAVPIIRSASELGGRFTEKRDILGVALEKVASLAAVLPQDLTLFEDGKKKIPVRQIERIAQILAVDAFSSNGLSEGDRELALRLRNYGEARLGSTGFSPSLVSQLSEIGWIIKQQSEIQSLFGYKQENVVREMGFEPCNNYGPPPYRWGYKLAHKTRQLLGLSQEEPIKCLRLLIEGKLGIPIIQADLPNTFAGATLSNGSSRGIVLNLQGYNQNPWIRRNTLAHELGHLLWDPVERLNSLRVDTFGEIEQFSEEAGDPVEARANAFAAELLAPRNSVNELLKSYSLAEDAIQEVCEKFGIGPSAARYQIQNSLNDGAAINLPAHHIDPSDDWVAAENFTSDFLPMAAMVPVIRRGKFSYWVARAAVENKISLDTAGSYLGLDARLTIEQGHSIVSIFSEK